VKPGARITFATSLAANVAALYILWAPTLPADAPPVLADAPARAAEVVDAAVDAAIDVVGYRDGLLARGLSLEETKPLVLAWLMAQVPAEPASGADEYWRSGYSVAAVENVRKKVAAADRVRARLIDLYGAQARLDGAFAPVFAPFDVRYAFLAPEQQVALQKLQLDRQLNLARSASAKPLPAAGVTEPASGRSSATAQTSRELQERLGSDAALQYLYRFSSLAEQLRASDIDLSAPDFRGAFAALLEFEAATDPATFTRTREALRSTLGGARFTKLWAARDPLFGVIAAEGQQHGLADGAISAAYAVFNDTQDRLAAAASRFTTAVDPPQAAAALNGIQQDMKQQLANLVGQDVAEALVRASARFSMSMRPASSANPKE
jgi:hypothetical protein